jgi:molybdopterin converting factor small subunit
MNNIIVNLDGISTEIHRSKIPLSKLILDIENPRIQYFLDTRLNDNINQEKIKFALSEGNDQYEKLKEHIESNKGIYESIWVVPDNDFYKVIEGNTRAFIYEELAEKYANDDNWQTIPSYILPHKIDRKQINFIRLEKHLFGQTPWSAYEKARELYRLHDKEDYSLKRLEQLTKLRASEIQNNIQAYKDMEDQYLKKYNKPAERLKFSYFVEFRKNKELKKLVKKGLLSLFDFCDWVGEGKFRRGEDIRRLPLVLKDKQAKQELIDDNFQAALDQLEQKNPAAKSKLYEKIEDVINGIERIHLGELNEIKDGMQPGKVDSLVRLYDSVTKILKNIGTIK